jgi:hypothetical protein
MGRMKRLHEHKLWWLAVAGTFVAIGGLAALERSASPPNRLPLDNVALADALGDQDAFLAQRR